MLFKNTNIRYGAIAVLFHWIMAAIVIGMLCLGLFMVRLPVSLEKLSLYGWHKSFGILVLMLVILRLSWRLMSVIPPLPEALHQWQKLAAHASHWALYLCLFLMPLSGWLMSSAAGLPVSFFGWFVLPTLIAPDPSWRVYFLTIHQFTAFGLIGLIGLHTAAALQHHFIEKDNILRRMLPW